MRPYYQDDLVTLYHGDCREVLPGLSCDVIVSDPPYGADATSGWGGAFGGLRIVGDASTELRDWLAHYATTRRLPALLFGSPRIARPLGCRAVLIWDKGEHVGMGDLSLPWSPNYEEIHVLGVGWHGHRGSSVIRSLSPAAFSARSRVHPMQKPVGLMAALIEKAPDGVVADPFAGSGATLAAAKLLGRRAIGIEIEERYCEVAAKRLAQEVLPLESAMD